MYSVKSARPTKSTHKPLTTALWHYTKHSESQDTCRHFAERKTRTSSFTVRNDLTGCLMLEGVADLPPQAIRTT